MTTTTHLIKLKSDGSDGPKCELLPGIIKIGRGEDCDVQMKIQCVSRLHVEIIVDENGDASIVNRSINGTALNGSILPKGGRSELKHNDKFVVGNRVFRFCKLQKFQPKAACFAAAGPNEETAELPPPAFSPFRKARQSIGVALAVADSFKDKCIENSTSSAGGVANTSRPALPPALLSGIQQRLRKSTKEGGENCPSLEQAEIGRSLPKTLRDGILARRRRSSGEAAADHPTTIAESASATHAPPPQAVLPTSVLQDILSRKAVEQMDDTSPASHVGATPTTPAAASLGAATVSRVMPAALLAGIVARRTTPTAKKESEASIPKSVADSDRVEAAGAMPSGVLAEIIARRNVQSDIPETVASVPKTAVVSDPNTQSLRASAMPTGVLADIVARRNAMPDVEQTVATAPKAAATTDPDAPYSRAGVMPVGVLAEIVARRKEAAAVAATFSSKSSETEEVPSAAPQPPQSSATHASSTSSRIPSEVLAGIIARRKASLPPSSSSANSPSVPPQLLSALTASRESEAPAPKLHPSLLAKIVTHAPSGDRAHESAPPSPNEEEAGAGVDEREQSEAFPSSVGTATADKGGEVLTKEEVVSAKLDLIQDKLMVEGFAAGLFHAKKADSLADTHSAAAAEESVPHRQDGTVEGAASSEPQRAEDALECSSSPIDTELMKRKRLRRAPTGPLALDWETHVESADVLEKSEGGVVTSATPSAAAVPAATNSERPAEEGGLVAACFGEAVGFYLAHEDRFKAALSQIASLQPSAARVRPSSPPPQREGTPALGDVDGVVECKAVPGDKRKAEAVEDGDEDLGPREVSAKVENGNTAGVESSRLNEEEDDDESEFCSFATDTHEAEADESFTSVLNTSSSSSAPSFSPHAAPPTSTPTEVKNGEAASPGARWPPPTPPGAVSASKSAAETVSSQPRASDLTDLTVDLSDAIQLLFGHEGELDGCVQAAQSASPRSNRSSPAAASASSSSKVGTPNSQSPPPNEATAGVASPLPAVAMPTMGRSPRELVAAAAAEMVSADESLSFEEAADVAAASLVAGTATAVAELRRRRVDGSGASPLSLPAEEELMQDPVTGELFYRGSAVVISEDFSTALARVFASPLPTAAPASSSSNKRKQCHAERDVENEGGMFGAFFTRVLASSPASSSSSSAASGSPTGTSSALSSKSLAFVGAASPPLQQHCPTVAALDESLAKGLSLGSAIAQAADAALSPAAVGAGLTPAGSSPPSRVTGLSSATESTADAEKGEPIVLSPGPLQDREDGEEFQVGCSVGMKKKPRVSSEENEDREKGPVAATQCFNEASMNESEDGACDAVVVSADPEFDEAADLSVRGEGLKASGDAGNEEEEAVAAAVDVGGDCAASTQEGADPFHAVAQETITQVSTGSEAPSAAIDGKALGADEEGEKEDEEDEKGSEMPTAEEENGDLKTQEKEAESTSSSDLAPSSVSFEKPVEDPVTGELFYRGSAVVISEDFSTAITRVFKSPAPVRAAAASENGGAVDLVAQVPALAMSPAAAAPSQDETGCDKPNSPAAEESAREEPIKGGEVCQGGSVNKKKRSLDSTCAGDKAAEEEEPISAASNSSASSGVSAASATSSVGGSDVAWPSVGSRVRVWFDEEEIWGLGSVTKVTKPKATKSKSKPSKKQGRIYVEYDDGDEGYCDFPEEGIEIIDEQVPESIDPTEEEPASGKRAKHSASTAIPKKEAAATDDGDKSEAKKSSGRRKRGAAAEAENGKGASISTDPIGTNSKRSARTSSRRK